MGAIPIIGTEPVTILRNTMNGRDELGKAIYVVSQVLIPNAIVAPRTSERKINGVTEYFYDNSYVIYFPPGTGILSDDEFLVRGMRFQTDGGQKRWDLAGDVFNPAGIEVNVRNYDGRDKQ